MISVGAVTEHGCLAQYSDFGPGLDLVAPGGGADADLPGEPQCHPNGPDGGPILQLTYLGNRHRFGYPTDYVGTSMATPHVAAAAAMVIASGVLGAHPTAAAVERRLKATAHKLGPARYYGAGLLDAGAATAP